MDQPLYPSKKQTKTTIKKRLDKIITQLYGNGAIHNLVDKAKTDHRIVMDIFRSRASLEPKETKADNVIRIEMQGIPTVKPLDESSEPQVIEVDAVVVDDSSSDHTHGVDDVDKEDVHPSSTE